MKDKSFGTNDWKEVIAALRMLKVQTGSFACLGCGYEHSCSTNGCAILRAAADLLESQTHDRSLAEPLTQADLDKMNFDKVWLSYGAEPDDGEWALVYRGRIYSINTLEGAGFEDMLNDLISGETLDSSTGSYTVHRHIPECIDAFRRKLRGRIGEAACDYKEAEENGDDDFINYDARDHFHFLMGLQEAGKMLDDYLLSLSRL